jgi:hypothetical protein
MQCVACGSSAISERPERTAQGYRRFRCRDCGKQFNERSTGVLNRTQYPSDVVALVVLWRLRYKLSLRDLAEMFLIRGIVFSYEAVRDWETKLTPALAENLRRRRRRGKIGRSWYVDETYVKIQGRWCYLYRAIDRSGALVDVRLSETRDMAAARRSFVLPRRSPASRRPGLRRTGTTVTQERSGPNSAKLCGTVPIAISIIGLSRITEASRADTNQCVGSNAGRALPGFVEVMTNYETSSDPAQTATNMFPPITTDCTSSPAASRCSAFCRPRDGICVVPWIKLYLLARTLTEPFTLLIETLRYRG